MQLKKTIKKDDDFTVVLSDGKKALKKYYEKLVELKIFDEIYCFSEDSLYNVRKGIIKKSHKIILRKVKYSLFGKNIYGLPKNKKYDELIYSNDHSYIQFLYSYLRRKNKNVKCSIYEEGLLFYSYSHKFNDKYVKKTCDIFRLKNIIDSPQYFYCFEPSLYKGKLQAVKIPKIEKNPELKSILHDMFFLNRETYDYKEKYIFFPTVYDIDFSPPLGELQLAKEIAKTVGKDNLLIKVHPRDNPERFTREGLRVDPNSDIPWEVIQMAHIFSDKVFLTVLSGSVINLAPISGNQYKAYVLFPLVDVDKIPTAKNFSVFLMQLLQKNKLPYIKLVKNLEEIKGE